MIWTIVSSWSCFRWPQCLFQLLVNFCNTLGTVKRVDKSSLVFSLEEWHMHDSPRIASILNSECLFFCLLYLKPFIGFYFCSILLCIAFYSYGSHGVSLQTTAVALNDERQSLWGDFKLFYFPSKYEILIAKFRLKLKKVGKTTRPLRYDPNQIPYDYTAEVRNRFKSLELIGTVMNV